MRTFWDARARENAMWFVNSTLDYRNPDAAAFWASGEEALRESLDAVGAALGHRDRVLEIGCGIGRITRALAARTAHVVGIDISEEMITRAKAALSNLDNVTLQVSTGTGLDGIANADFDVVYSFVVFQHIPDPEITYRYIRDIGRVLRPGGHTVFHVSERPDVHMRARWAGTETAKVRLGRLFGRQPRGCLAPEWLGSSLTRPQLLDALRAGGLTLKRTAGDGTQFCLVFAQRPTD